MNIKLAGVVFCFALSVAVSVAQTNVTTTNGGASGSVPVFTSNKNVENSAITQSNGNVGIGTTTPNGALQVVGTGSNVVVLGEASPSNGKQIVMGVNTAGSGVGTIQAVYQGTQYIPLILNPNGSNVGIGTTTPSQPLEVNGNAQVDGTLNVTGTGGVNVESGGIVFPDGTLQSTAYPASSSGGNAPIEVQNNEAVINGGVSANGTGIKHVRTDASCTTGTGIGSNCSIQVNWPGAPFADANYTVVCIPKAVSFSGGSASYDLTIPDANKATTYTTVTISTLEQATSTTVTGLDCIAVHD